ncbi:hypothetical protein MTO96_040948 [Rhipicephalus appendiculatus]
MSAGKVLALVVVVPSFAIVAVVISWCCWCVRSCIGTADKSIQAVKSMATVADTMESSARAVKSSLISATFPTTATTATMTTHPRVVASEPRMLKQAAQVEVPAKPTLPPFASVLYHSATGSACTPPNPTEAAKTPDLPTTKSADSDTRSSPPKSACSDDHHPQKTSLEVGERLQRRISKVDLFHREANAVTPQPIGRSFQPSAPGSEAHGLKQAKVEVKSERASAVKTLELRNTVDDASGSFELASATTPSLRSSRIDEVRIGKVAGKPGTPK